MRPLLFLPVLAALLGAASPSGPARGAVAWQPWSPESFARARAAGKPLLVDAEATWCHWCHVMDETTYGDPGIARRLNALAVAVKVDIDVHPDAQELYADIGWPGTAVYAPDGRILYRHRGYLEPAAFRRLLDALEAQAARGRFEPLEPEEEAEAPAAPAAPQDLESLRRQALAQLAGSFDEDHGGWGRQKYPLAANVEHAFLEARLRQDAGWKLRALYTLAQQRAITDPTWGGLFQYSVGPDWHEPHFERLTTLQAGYLGNLAEAFLATGDGDFLRDGRRVLGFLDRFMADPAGGWYATMDADLGGQERAEGRRARHLDGHAYQALPDRARVRLGVPRIDRRVYARENGLMIAALARWSALPGEGGRLEAARRAAERMDRELGTPEGGYFHEKGQRRAVHLGDQAAMLQGLLALHEATGEARWLDRAEGLAAFVRGTLAQPDGRCRSRADLGGAAAAGAAIGAFGEVRLPFDDNALWARGLAKLHAFTGREADADWARRILEAQAPQMEAQGRWLGDCALALEALAEPPAHLTVVGPRTDPRNRALFEAAGRIWLPGVTRVWHDPAEGAPRNPDLGFPPVQAPSAFLCGRGACSSPFTDPESLESEVGKALRHRAQ